MDKLTNLLLTLSLFQILQTQLHCQPVLNSKPNIEIGVDFLNYNRNWQYYNGTYLEPFDGKDFVLEAIPALFIKIPLKNYSVRSKFEYFQSQYLFLSNGGTSYQEVDGIYKESRLLLGIEKAVLNKRLSLYYIIDFAISFSNFNGLYTHSGDLIPGYDTHDFNTNSVGIGIQPGLGMNLKITEKIKMTIETSALLSKGWDSNDTYFLNHDNRFILRPISLCGLSYRFGKKD